MCGIVGALTFDPKSSFKITKPYLVRMRDVMAHRGPDGAGIWISEDSRIGLGHRRLAIIDLSQSAEQPMANLDESAWISYNGEIYNHEEIRQELKALGHTRWKTDHSDTEVVLRAFEVWGIDCVSRLRGMFAFAYWDGVKKELWLVRDRLGIKPLYYSIHHGRLTFASEIKALLQDPDQPREVDEHSFYHFLTFLTSPAPDTLFQGIKKLPAGTWLRISETGETKTSRYWDVWDHTDPQITTSEREITAKLLEELRISVRLHKLSDVPIGVFLSGGIDSSTNVALFSEGSIEQPVRAFTIGYDQEYPSYKNEMEYAREMAKRVNAEYHERLLTQNDLIAFIPKMIELQDEPIADPVCFPLYFLSQLARDHGVIACQVGEGSDELFLGYDSWKTKLRLAELNHWPVPTLFKSTLLFGLGLSDLQNSQAYEALRRGTAGEATFWSGADVFTQMEKQKLLSKRLQKKLKGLSSWEVIKPIRERFDALAWEKSELNWMTYADLNLRLPELLLMRVDKMSMGVSLEGRVPFLDHKFVELVMSIPTSMKYQHGVLKYLLKQAIRGLIPEELIHRKKQGFGVPIREWLTDRLGNSARKILKQFCDETDFLTYSEVTRYLEERDQRKVWYLLNFALWWRHYIAGNPSTNQLSNLLSG